MFEPDNRLPGGSADSEAEPDNLEALLEADHGRMLHPFRLTPDEVGKEVLRDVMKRVRRRLADLGDEPMPAASNALLARREYVLALAASRDDRIRAALRSATAELTKIVIDVVDAEVSPRHRRDRRWADPLAWCFNGAFDRARARFDEAQLAALILSRAACAVHCQTAELRRNGVTPAGFVRLLEATTPSSHASSLRHLGRRLLALFT